jgi:hypothetical protein
MNGYNIYWSLLIEQQTTTNFDAPLLIALSVGRGVVF